MYVLIYHILRILWWRVGSRDDEEELEDKYDRPPDRLASSSNHRPCCFEQKSYHALKRWLGGWRPFLTQSRYSAYVVVLEAAVPAARWP